MRFSIHSSTAVTIIFLSTLVAAVPQGTCNTLGGGCTKLSPSIPCCAGFTCIYTPSTSFFGTCR
ncbi:hypothetical protein BDZ94DRAFT_1251113 [Collybia nuda]|uniref:Uncharacterized protein n=1 Tax=Collybia nuda TaxID=64659 RepID=A0A9P5YD92_9AGAR|nr:hypothetical protein BDZ94DRAFT_1251113 [Collybia nuda]